MYHARCASILSFDEASNALSRPDCARCHAGCVRAATLPPDDHANHPMPTAASMAAVQPSSAGLPAGGADVAARIAASTRHAEWAMIRVGNDDSVRAWVVYPERSTKAPVVVVV